MKYKVTLNKRVYEVEVEHGEATLLSEYDPASPAKPVPGSVSAAAAPNISQGDSAKSDS